ncbi:ROK family protein [Roseibacterium beibuensis]|uniref:ROK family protein n=1 Tax=[Roseibacterium] beibuensis TaxID=1193142 RepID=UPI00217E9EC7|nr:ROK family protein [Roseibacterium beibuensis]MCS6627222.1 ROK family protein [Roseibacterium beibuensis]
MRIGIDFGGTKIEAAVIGDDGSVLARKREPNPGAYDAAIETVSRLIGAVEAETGASGPVGVAAPGSVSPTSGLMRNANSTWLNGRAFPQDLEAALGRPVRLANDANCLALSEAVDGAGDGKAVVFAIIVGTGCGGGVAVNGGLVEGANGVAGEWGHTSLPWPSGDEAPGPACWCGLNGCLETWVSGSGLQRDHRERTGQSLTAEQIVAGAGAGDAHARRSLDLCIDRLGRAIAMVVNLIDPDAFVLGGGLSNVDEIYTALPPVVERYAFTDAWSGIIAPARWGDSSGVRGAARLWPSPTVQETSA